MLAWASVFLMAAISSILLHVNKIFCLLYIIKELVQIWRF